MIRDSGSVKLIWSLEAGTASAGDAVGGDFPSALRRAASSAASIQARRRYRSVRMLDPQENQGKPQIDVKLAGNFFDSCKIALI
jgi:hypothetical protein